METPQRDPTPIENASKGTTLSRNLSRNLRLALGVLFWCALLSLSYYFLEHQDEKKNLSNLKPVASWYLNQKTRVRVQFPHAVPLTVGDPVVFGASKDEFKLIGEVEELYFRGTLLPKSNALASSATLSLLTDGSKGINEGSSVTLVRIPQNASWIIKTLIPEEKATKVWNKWNDTLLLHREKIFKAIHPVTQKVLADLQEIVIQDLPRVLQEREASIRNIGKRFQRDILEKEFKPILERDLWPQLSRRARPTIDALGREILRQAPLWTFTWKYIYQKLPFTQENLVGQEWERFVTSQVQPLIKERLGDLFKIVQDVIDETKNNPRVAAAFERALGKVLNDAELQHEIRLAFQKLILDNSRFHRSILKNWRSPEAEQAIDELGKFMGPLIASIGEEVLGSRGGGITPEFARILRTQLLQKDRQWIWIEPGLPTEAPLTPKSRLKAEISRDG